MTPTKKWRRAAAQSWVGYCRKSTDSEDRQVHTLADQAALVQAHYDRLPPTERQGHPLRLFQEAQSAYRPGRPVFDAVLAMADRGEVRGLIVVHPNRVSRNHADSGAFVQRLVEGAIPTLDMTSGKRYTGADSNDIFMLTLEGAMSWKDSRDKGDRILQAMRMRAAEGRHMGPVHLGYRSAYRPDGTATLEIVPTVAPLIRQLFELAATGTYSVRALTAEVERWGLRSRTGKRLGSSAVHEILRDPLYKGYVRFDGVTAKGRHESTVGEDVWQRVQDILSGRRRGIGKPKDPGLRELFVFGNLLQCPRCGRTLCPYRVKGKYVYYECRNVQTRCGVLVPQPALVDQLSPLLSAITLREEELVRLRGLLLAEHRLRAGGEVARRGTLHAEYEKIVREIGDVFSQRKEAEALGVLDAVDLRLAELRGRRDDVQSRLNSLHERGDAWVEQVLRSFRLIELLREAVIFGSGRVREQVLRAVASNWTVAGRKLVPELRTPFKECVQRGDRPEWWATLDDVRTEIAQTADLMQNALAVVTQAKILAAAQA